MPSSYRFTFDSYTGRWDADASQVTVYTTAPTELNQISQATVTLPHPSLVSSVNASPRGDSVLAARCGSARALEAEKGEDDLWVSEHLHVLLLQLCWTLYRFNKSLYGAPHFYHLVEYRPKFYTLHPSYGPVAPSVPLHPSSARRVPDIQAAAGPPRTSTHQPQGIDLHTTYSSKPASSVPAQLVGRANRGCRPRRSLRSRFATRSLWHKATVPPGFISHKAHGLAMADRKPVFTAGAA